MWLIQLALGEFSCCSNLVLTLYRDNFTGVYAVEYLKKKETGAWNIKNAILRANKACALNIMMVGCQDGIPWSDEIDAFEAEINNKALGSNGSSTTSSIIPEVLNPKAVLEKASVVAAEA
jgi:hypothetical protein